MEAKADVEVLASERAVATIKWRSLSPSLYPVSLKAETSIEVFVALRTDSDSEQPS